MRRVVSASLGPALVLAALACSRSSSAPSAADAGAAYPPIVASARDVRFVVREHMLAAVEMQLSGEPFAQSMGRQLSGYSRDTLPPNIYFDPAPSSGPWIDLPGFSAAVESYEYSKQPMNDLAFESGAGLSLAYGPVVNPGGGSGCAPLRAAVQHLGATSHATSRFVHAEMTDANPLGWLGIWPAYEPFESFDPTIAPSNSVAESCSITSDDDPGATGALMSDDYECDATSLHLPDRATQVDRAISPGASGWAGWKSALWALNYLEVMHDSNESPVTSVPADQLALVGVPGNTVLSNDVGDVPSPVPGTFLGSSDIEGFQAGMMLTGLDNEALDWLTARMTSDGRTLGGFPDVTTALAYAPSAPLAWFPAEIAVTETTDPSCAFPRPTGYAIRSADSHLLDLAGLLGTYASLYALTDHANPKVGGSQACEAYFDGDPFPADDQIADGEPTLHDRALAMVRVTLVNLLRMHVDPASGIPVDDVAFTNGAPVRGTTLSAPYAAYTLLALRTTRRSLSDLLTLYTNTTPDTATMSTPIDSASFSATNELNTRIGVLAALFYDHLTDATGRAYDGWDVGQNVLVTPTDDALDAHTAAIRAQHLAFLATGDVKYRERAVAVYERVESVFWDPTFRVYQPVAGARGGAVTYTPLRFAMTQAMLRDTYELVGAKNDDTALAAELLARVARLNKLVLNGWDDRNGDERVDWPQECVFTVNGFPAGGLQMAERTLSGETGSLADVFDAGPRVVEKDREQDCVPEISAAQLPSALADSLTFTLGTGP